MHLKPKVNYLENCRIDATKCKTALLLHHFEDYLRIINIGVEHALRLGFFSEQVLES